MKHNLFEPRCLHAALRMRCDVAFPFFLNDLLDLIMTLRMIFGNVVGLLFSSVELLRGRPQVTGA